MEMQTRHKQTYHPDKSDTTNVYKRQTTLKKAVRAYKSNNTLKKPASLLQQQKVSYNRRQGAFKNKDVLITKREDNNNPPVPSAHRLDIFSFR